MIGWWQALTTFEQVMATIAIPASVLIVIQLVLLIIGMGSDGYDGDGDFESGDGISGLGGLRLFSLRTILAFLAMTGWVALYASQQGAHPIFALVIGVFAGAVTGFLVAYAFKQMSRLLDQGNVEINNAVGHMATVYIPIPAKREGKGKITLNLQERYIELSAVTDSEKPLKTGTSVRVVGQLNEETVLVASEF